MSSIWGSRFSDEGGQHSVSYRSRKDEGEIDVGDILAAARNELPYIPSHRLTHDMFLGRGSSYQVTREVYANPRVSEFYVAVKCLRTVTESDYVRTKRYAAVLREVRVLTHPPLRSHGCIVPALGYGWKRDTNEGARPFMVMDYSDHGSLPQYLNRCRIPFHERIEFGIDIAAGLKSLHACGIIHGDLKPDNVMVFDHGDRLSKRPQGAKLADFGCSIFEQDFNAAKDVFYLGTPKYNAPEIVGRLSPYVDAYVQSFDSFALADCYSFGLSLWELLRNGKDYIEDSLLQKDEGPAAFLARISATQEDGLLALATDYCDHIPDRTQGDFSIPSLKLLFSLTLKDRRSCRATMEEVGRVLAGESRERRPVLQYPLAMIQPFQEIEPISGTASDGRISVPRKSSEISVKEERGLGLIKRQYSAIQEISFQHRHLDLLGLAMEPPIPWDVQCDSVNGLKEAASFDKDAKATQAHFQLAVAYRIGFGLEMSPSKAQFHLQSMRLQDPVAEAVVKRISTSLEHEQSDWSSIQKSIPAPESAENFSELFRDLYQADYQNLTGQLPADVHDIMLNAKEHPFDVKPSVFHWLILVPPSKARAVLSQYKSKHHSTWKDSEKRVLDLSVSEPIIIREFCLELFGTPLHWAVRTANIQLLELLIEFGADVNVCWGTTILAEVERPRTAYMSPLGLATMYHLESITRLLLDVGAEPSWNGCSAAHMIGERTIPFSRAVLHAGNSRMAAQRTIAVLASYYSRKDTLGHTPLSRALGNPNAEAYVIEELIAGSLRGDIALGESDHNLCCIVARACSARRFSSWKLSLIESLLTDIDGTDRTGLNALHIAAQAGSHDVVEFLIDHGADVNTMTTDSSHNTALALAARNGCTTVVELLLVAHAQLELTNNCDETALEQAIIASNREIVSLLIGAGAKTTFSKTTFSCDEDAIGSTILHAAAKSKPGSLSTIVRELIRDFAELCKSYVNVSDYQGWTPLHYSAYYGNLRDTKALLDLGAVVLPSWSTALIDLLQSVIEDAQNQQFAPEHALIEREGPEAVRDFIGRLSGIIIELEQHVKPESS